MLQAMRTGASALQAQQNNLNVISNNVANVSTSGFKKSRANFEQLSHVEIRKPGVEVGEARMPSGTTFGTGVRLISTQEIHSQGGFKQTDSQLDVALSGDGFFQVILPSGETAYTRNGAFQLDAEGNVVTNQGYLLEPQINVPEDAESIVISGQGVISVKIPGENELQEVGVFELAKFINPSGLVNKGNNVYLVSDSSGAPIVGEAGVDGYARLIQQQLETSNVNIAEEMVAMMEGQKSYELAAKVVSGAGDNLNTLIDVLR